MFKHGSLFGKLVLAVFTFMSVMVFTQGTAFAATATWDGEAGDNNLSTAANWVGDVAPVDGDTLVFDSDVYDYSGYNLELNNTALTTIAGVTLQGANSGSVTIIGNQLELTGDVIDSATGLLNINFAIDISLGATINVGGANFGAFEGGQTLSLGAYNLTLTDWCTVYSDISGSGSISVNDFAFLYNGDNSSYSGDITVNSGGDLRVNHVSSLGDNTGITTIASGATWGFATAEHYAVADITLAEDFSTAGNMYVANSFGYGGGSPEVQGTFTFSGTVTLTGDIELLNSSKHVVFDDLVEGSYTLTHNFSSEGNLTINGEEQAAPEMDVQTIAKGDDLPDTPVTVLNNQKYIINGTRGSVSVYGILAGTGTVGDLYVDVSGVLAPGLSPGCLASGNLNLDGTLEIEIDGATVCSQYDQTTVTGTVDVTDATLSILKSSSYNPEEGVEFIIISNDGSDEVTGTFSGLAEGSTVTVDGVVYVVSYVGGDGNDVTLTVQSVPDAPDTGFGIIASSPYTLTVLALLSSAALFVTARAVARNRF